MENTETNTETTTENTATDAPPAPAAEAKDPSIIGKLTPEEQAALMGIRQESQQLLAKVGEHEVLKMRILAKLDELDEKGQGHINAISQRLNLSDGQQWVALQDGTVRLVTPPASSQNEGGA